MNQIWQLVLVILSVAVSVWILVHVWRRRHGPRWNSSFTITQPDTSRLRPDDLVTVAQPADSLTAGALRTELESENIESIISGLNDYYWQQIQLKVRAEDAEHALQVLNGLNPPNQQ